MNHWTSNEEQLSRVLDRLAALKTEYGLTDVEHTEAQSRALAEKGATSLEAYSGAGKDFLAGYKVAAELILQRDDPFITPHVDHALAKVLIAGVAGSGKTIAALDMAAALGQHIGVVDTEGGSSALYAGLYKFGILNLGLVDPFNPRNPRNRQTGELIDFYSAERFLKALVRGEENRDVLVFDSLTALWDGLGGTLEQVDRARATSKNQMAPWNLLGREYNNFMRRVIQSPVHVIATARTKTDWLIEGAKVTRVGTKTNLRDGSEHEFHLVLDIAPDHTITVVKSRYGTLHSGEQYENGAAVAARINEWIDAIVNPAPPKNQESE